MFRVEVDQESCIGCGACVAACEDNFELNDDGKAQVKQRDIEEIGCSQEAADNCPVSCIKVTKVGK